MIITDNIRELPRTWYHGTTSNHLASLEKGINLKKGRRNTDFGQGFYLTSNWDTALRWGQSSVIHSKKRTDNQNEPLTPIIMEYEIDTESLSDSTGILYQEAHELWLEAIIEHRLLNYSEIFNDYTYGPMADGNIKFLLHQIKIGQIENRQLLNALKSKKHLFPTDHQLVLHTSVALEHIKKKGVFDHGKYSWKTYVEH